MGTTIGVKICGITRPMDAFLAVALGARYVGFVFAKSPRAIKPKHAAEIVALLPRSVVPVGVFVNAPRDHVLDVICETGIRLAQFHGLESPEYCASFGAFPVMKAFRVKEPFGIGTVAPFHNCMYLLDAWNPAKAGGTGETFDWTLAAPVAREVPVVLAGGLTPENVVAAIEAVRPWAVDVSSGVEESPGKKDPEKLRAFFGALERAGYHVLPEKEAAT